ncbi:hypothetical protein [Schinkia azotoformans]|uniref:hypothetical protein n=1 Tax=Schinkia azotoformans TaxID=1454 RepID=UPI002DBDCBED|nr:hypothetical protein [Schinkia azotoformans]MEC1715929.1 hypothetical protein [Schinkia azotoformans]MEC1741568.1 hypothetical protein [Schinkia azotoformans]MEC1744562.1 hypothetical protein [Schinkia azotoformans]MEC1756270.1 hypothetical protein [Schinkia azotoformans]MEC1765249.1 hypothetical protein [Schinkia azotoformans]
MNIFKKFNRKARIEENIKGIRTCLDEQKEIIDDMKDNIQSMQINIDNIQQNVDEMQEIMEEMRADNKEMMKLGYEILDVINEADTKMKSKINVI